MLRASPLALCAVLTSAAYGQALVKDINTLLVNGSGVASTATQAIVVGTAAFFPANDGVNGTELWKTDGTAAGTVLVKDINTTTATASSSPSPIAAFGSNIIFGANDGLTGIELWISDGTAAGTVLVKDIYPGASTTSSSPSGFTVIGSLCYFMATDATATTGTGRELWVTDGTTAGTVMVKDIQAGTGNGVSGTGNMVAVGTTLYFAAVDVATTGTELWKSDGTLAGTVMVKDINATASGSSSPALLTPFGSKLIFNANDGVAGIEPWVSDGTLAGTVLLMDIYPTSLSSSPSGPYTVAGPNVYFCANDGTAVTGTGREMYVTDGTPAGTKLIVDLLPGLPSGATTIGFLAIGSKCTFQGTTTTYGTDGYITDGTAAGTVLFCDAWPGPDSGYPAPFFAFGGKWYANASRTFAAGNFELVVTDGTPAGTALVKDIAPGGLAGDPNGFFIVNGKFCFMANDGATGVELWTSDGTTAGTVLVKDINAVGLTAGSASPGPMVKLGNKAYFAANDGITGIELWSTDGTTAGTTLVKDINIFSTASPASSSPTNLTVFQNKIFFTANNTTNGSELWVSDGTTAGTVLFKDINTSTATASSSPANFVVVGNQLFFTANDTTNGIELWVSDGTAAGTVLVKDINAGTASSSPTVMTAFGNKLFFRATEVNTGIEPWISDGTAAGTVQLKDIYALTSSSTPVNPTVVGSKLFFVATDSTATTGTGTELWVTDGTTAGTQILEVQAGTGSGALTTAGTIAPLGSGVVFSGNNGTAVNGAELWSSDGTVAGTVLVKDINVGTASASPTNMVRFGAKVLFNATNGTSGTEPFVTDGTNAGTFLLGDLYPGTGVSTPGAYVVAGGVAFFTAFDGTATTGTGRELYTTDGTVAGTVLVKDIYVGTSSGCSANPIAVGVGKNVVIMANDGLTGTELWTSNGTNAGTTLIGDLNPGSTLGSAATNFAILGDYLLFSATNGTDKVLNPAAVGQELRSLTLTSLGVSEAETFGTSCQGFGTPTIGTSGGAPFVGNATFSVDLSNAAASSPASLFLNNTRGDLPIGSCTIYPSLVPTININTATGPLGSAATNLPIPAAPWNIGVQLYFQYVVIDIGGPILGIASASNGLRIRIGGS